MKLHDFIPGIAYHAVSLYGFSPQTGDQWRATAEVLLRSFERLGVKPNSITMDDVPGFNEEGLTVEEWREWSARHEFPVPSMVAVGAGYFGRLDVRIGCLQTRLHGNVTTYPEGGQFILISDAGLHRWLPSVYSAIIRGAWSVKSFEYGYAHTHKEPMGFAVGSAELGDELHWRWQAFSNNMTREGLRYSKRLRDVFPLNYIVESQLNYTVGTQTLGEWIIASQARGSLTRLEPGLWSWSIPENILAQVRAALEPSGLLVAPGGS